MKVWIWICSPLTFSTTILSAIGPFTPTSLGIKGAPSPRQGCTLGGRPHAPSQHGARADMFRGIRPDIGRETRFLTFDSISRGGSSPKLPFEISPIVLVKFLLRTSYQQRFLKCIFFKCQRILTLETWQLLLVIDHWSHHDGNLKCYPAL